MPKTLQTGVNIAATLFVVVDICWLAFVHAVAGYGGNTYIYAGGVLVFALSAISVSNLRAKPSSKNARLLGPISLCGFFVMLWGFMLSNSANFERATLPLSNQMILCLIVPSFLSFSALILAFTPTVKHQLQES